MRRLQALLKMVTQTVLAAWWTTLEFRPNFPYRLQNCCAMGLICNPVTQPTPWGTVLQKRTVTQFVKKIPVFYATRRFIAVFVRVHQWFLPWATLIQSTTSYSISLRFILIDHNLPTNFATIHFNSFIPPYAHVFHAVSYLLSFLFLYV